MRKKRKPICTHCKSDNVRIDTDSSWNPDTDQWEQAGIYDNTSCLNCEGECSIEWIEIEDNLPKNTSERLIVLKQKWEDEVMSFKRSSKVFQAHVDNLSELNVEIFQACKKEGMKVSDIIKN